MSVQSSYFDFFLKGVSFDSKGDHLAANNPSRWELSKNRIAEIQGVWEKKFWLTAGLGLTSMGGFIASLTLTPPLLAVTLSISCCALLAFSLYRLCQVFIQCNVWGNKFLEIQSQHSALSSRLAKQEQLLANRKQNIDKKEQELAMREKQCLDIVNPELIDIENRLLAMELNLQKQSLNLQKQILDNAKRSLNNEKRLFAMQK